MACSERLAERLRVMLKGRKGIEEKRMFGGVGFLLHGNMACGVHKNDLIVRLGDEGWQAALRLPHARVFDMTGRPMKGWVMVSEKGCSTDHTLKGWLDKSMAFAKSLPPKWNL